MSLIDILIAAFLAISVLIGLLRGFVREMVALLFWVVGIWAAWTFAPRVEPYLGGLLSGPHVRPWVARLLILVAILLVGALVGFVLSLSTRASGLGVVDRVLGLMFGVARGLLALGVLVIGGELLHLNQEDWWHQSRLMPYCETVADWERALVGEKGQPWATLERLTGVKIK